MRWLRWLRSSVCAESNSGSQGGGRYAWMLVCQTVGAGIVVWEGPPIFQRLLAGEASLGHQLATTLWACLAVALLQLAFWLSSGTPPPAAGTEGGTLRWSRGVGSNRPIGTSDEEQRNDRRRRDDALGSRPAGGSSSTEVTFSTSLVPRPGRRHSDRDDAGVDAAGREQRGEVVLVAGEDLVARKRQLSE